MFNRNSREGHDREGHDREGHDRKGHDVDSSGLRPRGEEVTLSQNHVSTSTRPEVFVSEKKKQTET